MIGQLFWVALGVLSLTTACRTTSAPEVGGLDAVDAATDETPRDGATATDAPLDAHIPGAETRLDARTPDAQTQSDARASDASALRADAAVESPRSAGCGKSALPTDDFETRTVQVGDRERSYALLVPEGYTASRAYPLIFRLHGSGGDGLSGGLDIQHETDDGALIVAPDGLMQGWTERNEAADLALFDTLLAELSAAYCIDRERVYAYGFSAGAGFAELLACKRSDAVRAVAAIAGFDRTRGAACQGPVAAWLAHDRNDDAVPIARGQAARDILRKQNGCGTETTSEADNCVRYQGCSAGYPVVWCETQGLGHNIRGDYAPAAVWAFFNAL